jgi:hypothetical protein
MRNVSGAGCRTAIWMAACCIVASSARADEAPPTRDFDLFIQPVGIIPAAVVGGLYLPLGFAMPISPHADLVVEATPVVISFAMCSISRGGWAAIGLALFTGKRARSSGLFLQPKLVGQHFQTSPHRSDCGYYDIATELHAGLDVGYLWRWSNFNLAFVFGASLGYCGHCAVGSPFFFSNPFSDAEIRSTNRISLGLNLNLLRAGWSF